jgi:cysteine synthase
LTPQETAVSGALAKAKEIVVGLNGNRYLLQQFENPANGHGAIVKRRDQKFGTISMAWVDIFISGVGTGGTVTDVSQYIKGSAKHGCENLKAPLVHGRC